MIKAATSFQSLTPMPHSLEVEQAFLAGLMADNSKYYDIIDIVIAEHFYNMLNAKVFTAIGKLINSGKDASPLSLVDFMTHDSVMIDINGVEFLAELSNSIIGFNLVSYAEQIRDFYIRRALIQTYTQGIEDALKPSVELSTLELTQDAEQKIFAIGNYLEKDNRVSNAASLMISTIQSIELAYQAAQKDESAFLTTGIKGLDRIMGGMRPQNLIVVGAATGSGKTAFAVTVLMNIVKKQKSVFYASLEMSKEEIGERILSQETGLVSINIAEGRLNNLSMQKIIDCGKKLNGLNYHIDSTAQLSLASLRSKAIKLKRSVGLDLVIVDYLQLMGQSKKGENSLERVSNISRGLKGLAKEINVPIIALAQLSREPNRRENNRPRLSDLRESGTIEQDADVVLLLYREVEYLKGQEPAKGTSEYQEWRSRMDALEWVIEIDVAKNRRGFKDKVSLRFNPPTMTIED